MYKVMILDEAEEISIPKPLILNGHKRGNNICVVTPDSRFIVSASDHNRLIKVWNIATGNCCTTFTGHISSVSTLTVTTDSRSVISGCGDQTLKIWDIATGNCRATMRDYSGNDDIRSFKVTPNDQFLVSRAADSKKLVLWHVWRGGNLSDRKVTGPNSIRVREYLEGHSKLVSDCVVTQDSQRVISASHDGTLKVWNIMNGKCEYTLSGHTSWVKSCAVTPDGQRVVSAEDRTLKVWNIMNGKCEHTLSSSCDLSSFKMTSDGKRIILLYWRSTSNQMLEVWNIMNGRCEHTLSGHTDSVNTCEITPDAQRIISASDDGTLKVWNIMNGRCEHTLIGHTDRVNICEVTPDSQRIISASNDGTLKIWNIMNGRCEHTLSGHMDRVNVCRITPDSLRIISASNDGTLRVWDMRAVPGFGLPCLVRHTPTLVSQPAAAPVQPVLPPPPPIAVTPPPMPVQPVLPASSTTPSATPIDYRLKKNQRDDIVQRWKNGTPIATLLTERDSDNNTPLHRAAIRKQLNLCARLLLLDKSHRTTMEFRNQKNRTPFSYLSEREQRKVTSLKTHLTHTIENLRALPANILTGNISFQNAPSDHQNITAAITELYQYNELKPLLELAKLATLGLHDLSQRTSLPNDTGYDSNNEDEEAIKPNQKLRVIIDPNSDTVDGISYWGSNGEEGRDAVGVYTHNNILFIGGDRGSAQARRGTFIHELTHFVADEIYKNSCKPFRRDDRTNKRKFEAITGDLKSRKNSLDPLLARAFGDNYNTNAQNDSELIVRVPQMLVQYGYATGLSRLQAEAPDLLKYYQTIFLPAIERHIEILKLRTLGGWPLEIFTRGFSRSPGQLEMRLPTNGASAASSPDTTQQEPATFRENPFFHVHAYLVIKQREKPATIDSRIADFIQLLQSVTTTRGLTGHIDHAGSFYRAHPFASNRNRYHHLRRALLTLSNTELLRTSKEYRDYLNGTFKLSKLPRNDVHIAEMLRQRIAEGIIPNAAWSEA